MVDESVVAYVAGDGQGAVNCVNDEVNDEVQSWKSVWPKRPVSQVKANTQVHRTSRLRSVQKTRLVIRQRAEGGAWLVMVARCIVLVLAKDG